MRAYKTEIAPTPAQIQLIKETCGCVRYVYNQYIALNRERLKNQEKPISAMTFSKQFNNSPDRPEWVKRVSSKAVKQSMFNAEKGMWAYLKGKKKKGNGPKFKKKSRTESFYLIGTIHVERHRIFLPTLKWVKLKEFGYIPSNVKSVTVTMKNDRFYISCLVYETKDERFATSDEGVGIDFGLTNQFITPDITIPSVNKSPRIRKLEKKLRREQRALSRKYEANVKERHYGPRGKCVGIEYHKPLHECRNYQKQALVVAKTYEQLANVRTEYNRRGLMSIINQKPRFIAIEDLNIRGMMKNRHLSKAIANAKWYESRMFLQSQCDKYGIELRIIPRFYPSSKLCSDCGFKNTELKLKDREWTCPNCHSCHDRDINGALNIQNCKTYTVTTSS